MDVEQGKFVWHPGSVGNVLGTAFSGDGKYVAVVGGVTKLAVYQLSDGKLVRNWSSHQSVFTPRFSPDSTAILIALSASTLQLTDIPSGEARWQLDIGQSLEKMAQVVFDPKGEQLLLASNDGPAMIVDATTGEKRCDLDESNSVGHGRFSADGKRLLLQCADEVGIWDPQTGKRVRKIGERLQRFRTADLNADGQSIATVSRVGALPVVERGNGRTETHVVTGRNASRYLQLCSQWKASDHHVRQSSFACLER